MHRLIKAAGALNPRLGLSGRQLCQTYPSAGLNLNWHRCRHMSVLKTVHRHEGTACVDEGGPFSYQEMVASSESIRQHAMVKGSPLTLHQRVGIMVKPGRHFMAALKAIWDAGATAVPICLTHPPGKLKELQNVVNRVDRCHVS